MSETKYTLEEGNKVVRRLTLKGLYGNLFLLVLKFIGGFAFNSLALIADAFHTVSDIATDIIIMVGVNLGSKPADKDHAFGHGKYETLSGFILSIVLVLVGVGIAYKAGVQLFKGEYAKPEYLAAVVALISLFAKEYLYQITIRGAKKIDSVALYTNAWHHRSDAMSSVAVLVGIILALFGFLPGDSIAGLFVGILVIVVGIKFLFETIDEFVEGSLDEDMKSSIKSILNSHPEVKGWHQLRTRRVGREIQVDVHILVEQDLSVGEGHQIAEEVESAVKDFFNKPVKVLTHVEPDLPQERRISNSD